MIAFARCVRGLDFRQRALASALPGGDHFSVGTGRSIGIRRGSKCPKSPAQVCDSSRGEVVRTVGAARPAILFLSARPRGCRTAFMGVVSLSDSLNVDPERIRTHAGNVEKLAAPLAQALEAARAVSAPSDAFGKLCASLPPLFVDSVQEDGIAAIQAAIDAVGVDAGKLRQVADGFTTTDASNANKVKSAQSDLPGGAGRIR